MGAVQSPLEKMQKSASFQKAMLKPRASAESTVQEEDCDTIGAEELAGYNEPRRARLKVRFCPTHELSAI